MLRHSPNHRTLRLHGDDDNDDDDDDDDNRMILMTIMTMVVTMMMTMTVVLMILLMILMMLTTRITITIMTMIMMVPYLFHQLPAVTCVTVADLGVPFTPGLLFGSDIRSLPSERVASLKPVSCRCSSCKAETTQTMACHVVCQS